MRVKERKKNVWLITLYRSIIQCHGIFSQSTSFVLLRTVGLAKYHSGLSQLDNNTTPVTSRSIYCWPGSERVAAWPDTVTVSLLELVPGHPSGRGAGGGGGAGCLVAVEELIPCCHTSLRIEGEIKR